MYLNDVDITLDYHVPVRAVPYTPLPRVVCQLPASDTTVIVDERGLAKKLDKMISESPVSAMPIPNLFIHLNQSWGGGPHPRTFILG